MAESFVDRWLDRGERLLDSVAARAALSLLILVSVLPERLFVERGLGDLSPVFLVVFLPELIVRSAIVARRSRRRRLQFGEVAVLVLDLIAVASFLPFVESSAWRTLRLARLLLLLGYWGGLVRELWTLLGQRERRYQIALVLGLGGLLALAGAILLDQLAVVHDYDGDGVAGNDSFAQILWWTFRQIQDSGNLVPTVGDPALMTVSLLLTLAGLLLFSFVVGIGTTVVGEIVERSRSRPLGLRGHTVLLGRTPYTVILLRELAEIYRKNRRPYRGALMADAPPPDDLNAAPFRSIRYRRGDPARPADLDRVSLGHAKRALILGSDTDDPDAGVVAAILAVRRRHPTVPLYVDLAHERNLSAARAAGGADTHVVGSGSMLGYYVAQNVAFPGVHRLYRHLLQSAGSEIYTFVFSADERRRLRQQGPELDLNRLRASAATESVNLLGVLLHENPDAVLDDEDLDIVLNPIGAGRSPHVPTDHLRGLIGIARQFSDMTRLAGRVLDDTLRLVPLPSFPPRATTEMMLRPPRQRPERVLILGAGPRVPRVVAELAVLFPGIQITVLADSAEPLQRAADDTQAMLDRTLGSVPERRDEGGATDLQIATDGEPTRARFVAADWTHGHRLQRDGAVPLEAADVILLLPTHEGRGDSDGQIALDAFHLADLDRTGSVRFRRGVQVLALVRDPAKGDLLERRLIAMTAGREHRCHYTVMSRERARHRFLVQSLFVRGLNAIVLDVLSARGQHLGRLCPTALDGQPLIGPIALRPLADQLLDQGGLLVGYERRDDDGEVEIVIDPRHLGVGQIIEGASLRALFILGDRPALDRLTGQSPVDATGSK